MKIVTRRLREPGIRGHQAAAGWLFLTPVLGDEPMVAGGTVRPGVPWSRRGDGSGPLVVTKAGGFGDRTTLTDLLSAGTWSAAR